MINKCFLKAILFSKSKAYDKIHVLLRGDAGVKMAGASFSKWRRMGRGKVVLYIKCRPTAQAGKGKKIVPKRGKL